MANLVVNSTGVNLYGLAYLVANREKIDTYYQATAPTPFAAGGAAGSDTTQPKVVGGAVLIKGGSTATSFSNLDGIAPGQPTTLNGGSKTYRGFVNGVTCAIVTGSTTYAYVAACSGGYTNYKTTTNLAFDAATKILVFPSGSTAVAPQSGLNGLYGTQTVSVRGTGNFTTDLPLTILTTGYISQQVGMQALSATPKFADINKGKYIATRAGYYIAGVASDALKYMGNRVTRSIHKREAFRVTKTITALRAGSYNRFLGKWTAVPTIANDATAITAMGSTADHAANVTPRSAVSGSGSSQTTVGPGELVYKSGRPTAFGTADGATYTKKTT